jgi:uncharacterized protein involved in exopolysaccharide biosynthesis
MSTQSIERRLGRIERLLAAIAADLKIEIEMETQMSEASDALKAEVDQINTETSEVHAGVAAAGTVLASVETKLAEALGKATGISDEEAKALTDSLTTAQSSLAEAAKTLNEDAANAPA